VTVRSRIIFIEWRKQAHLIGGVWSSWESIQAQKWLTTLSERLMSAPALNNKSTISQKPLRAARLIGDAPFYQVDRHM
jgi:hypothetical protein